MERAALEALDRDTLVAHAETAGVVRARVLTRPELIDEILQRDPEKSVDETRRARGFLGLARDLLARIVERGLHLPDAAERIRAFGTSPPPKSRAAQTAVPTVTLAEIYATQGHKQKAIDTLQQVLAVEENHEAARALLTKLESGSVAVQAPLPPEADEPMGSSFLENVAHAEAPEPASMLDADPLPERYDTDECVAMTVDPTSLYVYWEIRRDTLARLEARMPGGKIALRILLVSPTWDGPRAASRDTEVSSEVGEWFLRDLPEGSVVRAAVGWLRDGLFVSAAHSSGVEPSREPPAPELGQWLAEWGEHRTSEVGAAMLAESDRARALARIEARRRMTLSSSPPRDSEMRMGAGAQRERQRGTLQPQLGGSSGSFVMRRPAPSSSWS